jgi:hypothetical protein
VILYCDFTGSDLARGARMYRDTWRRDRDAGHRPVAITIVESENKEPSGGGRAEINWLWRLRSRRAGRLVSAMKGSVGIGRLALPSIYG